MLRKRRRPGQLAKRVQSAVACGQARQNRTAKPQESASTSASTQVHPQIHPRFEAGAEGDLLKKQR